MTDVAMPDVAPPADISDAVEAGDDGLRTDQGPDLSDLLEDAPAVDVPLDADAASDAGPPMDHGSDLPGTCPVAVIAVTYGGGKPVVEGDKIPDGTPLLLDGTGSTSAGGEIVAWQWTAIQPSDLPVDFDPSDTSAETSLQVLYSGAWTLQLDVWDATGQKSCAPAALKFTVYGEDLHVQLLWSTEGTAELEATMLHAHLVHPAGFSEGMDADGDGQADGWFSDPWDCNIFNNWAPQWGDDAESVPMVDWEGNPQNISLTKTEDGLSYRVGVFYWVPNGWTTVTVTVQIYVHGVMAYGATTTLQNENDLWEVGEVTFPEGLVIPSTAEDGGHLVHPETDVNGFFGW